jgi:photosystem II stability/assembly factor-like uncharacterized protein
MRFSPTYAADNTLFCAGWTYVLRSTNRGSKWTRTRLSKASIPLQQLVMTISPDYEHDRGIYMGNRFGDIYRSRDGGKSFDIIGNAGGHVRSLVLSPEFATDSTMFAAIPKNPTVRVSVDGGETWSETARGLPRVMHLAMSPNYGTDRKLFAGTRNGLFVTTDQGQHWERVGEGAFGQSASCIESLAVSPDFANDNTLFVSVSGKGLFKSTDAAATFRPAGTALLEQGQIFANIPNPVAVPIVFSPAYATDGTLFGYSPTNVFRSTDRGETWSDISPKKTIHEMEPLGDRRADARVSQPVQLSLDAPAPIAVLETKPEAAPARERAAAGNGKAQAANPPAAGQAKAGPAKTEEPNSLRSLGRKVLTRIRPRR